MYRNKFYHGLAPGRHREVEGIELSAVYSRTMEKGKEFAAKYGVDKVYDNYEELAKDPEIDAGLCGSPTYCHFKHTRMMLNHKKHVLCEKPVASNLTELELMIQAAKENQVVFMEAMKSVHTPGFKAMKEHLSKIGTVRRATIQYCQYSSRYDKFKNGIIENAFKPELSNGAIMDIGVYCVHFLAALFGMPEKILADAIFWKMVWTEQARSSHPMGINRRRLFIQRSPIPSFRPRSRERKAA